MECKKDGVGIPAVKVKSLAQLKQLLKKDAEFRVVGHFRAEEIGKRRRVNIANTVGIYTINPDDPECETSKANGGRGVFLGWYTAPRWEFRDDGVCSLYEKDKEKTPENLLVAFRIISTSISRV